MSTAAPARRATWHDAFDVQMQLWRWTRPDAPGAIWIRQAFVEHAQALERRTAEMSARLWSAVNRQLLDADPIYVSEEMCELVEAARHSFQLEALLPTDLVTAHGFLYFQHPIVIKDKFFAETPIGAIGWGPVVGTTGILDAYGRDEVMAALRRDPLAYFKGKDYTDVWAGGDEEATGSVDGIAVTLYQPPTGGTAYEHGMKLVPIHTTPWWFGMDFGENGIDAYGDVTGAEWWWKLAQTTFRLMQQQISHRVNHQPDRPSRRDARRRGFHEKDVIVVRLRRERDDAAPDNGPLASANYSHRFIVGGHWRNQWYPSSAVHRQIWISPYVKGPEDAPLLVKPRRVYTWTR